MGRVNWSEWSKANPAPKEWARKPCPQCGAVTVKDATTMCRPTSSPSGDYECGTPDEAPRFFGFVHNHSDDWLAHSEEYWSVVAYDEGMTDEIPASLSTPVERN